MNSGTLGSAVAVAGQQMGTIIIDTTGLTAGSTFALSLAGSTFAGGSSSTCGSHDVVQRLTAVPEPSAFLFLSVLGTLGISRHWKRRQYSILSGE